MTGRGIEFLIDIRTAYSVLIWPAGSLSNYDYTVIRVMGHQR